MLRASHSTCSRSRISRSITRSLALNINLPWRVRTPRRCQPGPRNSWQLFVDCPSSRTWSATRRTMALPLTSRSTATAPRDSASAWAPWTMRSTMHSDSGSSPRSSRNRISTESFSKRIRRCTARSTRSPPCTCPPPPADRCRSRRSPGSAWSRARCSSIISRSFRQPRCHSIWPPGPRSARPSLRSKTRSAISACLRVFARPFRARRWRFATT